MNRKKFRIMIGVTAVLWLLSGIALIASESDNIWEIETPTVNEVSTGQLSGEIVKEMISRSRNNIEAVVENITPGDEIEHNIYVQNTGSQDMMIRLKVNKFWAKPDHPDVPLEELDPEMIEIDFADFEESQYWYSLEETDEAGIVTTWYYYREILAEDDITKEPLMTSYRMSTEAGQAYREKVAIVDVDLECLQATKEAIEEVWHVSEEVLNELDVTFPEPLTADRKATSEVVFKGPQNGFEYGMIEDDILLAFQNIVPGEHTEQNINISSDYDGEVEIGVYVNYVDPEDLHYDKDLELVNKLLGEHARVKVTGAKNTDIVFFDDAVWVSRPDDMEDPKENMISFGSFELKDSKAARVELSLSSEIGNEYQELGGYVQWVFVARGEWGAAGGKDPDPTPDPDPDPTPDPDPIPGKERKGSGDVKKQAVTTTPVKGGNDTSARNENPKTGDDTGVVFYGIFMVLSLLLFGMLLFYQLYRKKLHT